MAIPRFIRISRPIVRTLTLIVFAGMLAATTVSGQRPHFYSDDPIGRVPESQDASKAQPYVIEQMYEMVYNLFVAPGYKPSGLRAQNVNTIDEVPDSSWFTNRVGTKTVSAEELTRGPNAGTPPDPSQWVLTREKLSGAHPGFTARDAKGATFFLEFDPPYYPEGATAAVEIATKIFWALGYNQVESYITTFDPKNVTFDPNATIKRPSGARTPFTSDDLHSILEIVAKRKDGTYRVIAGRLVSGKVLGNYLYNGTRSDDPNDLVPHEQRRELRALRVFGAWTNLTDLKAANTLDALVTENGRGTIKHYLQDVGSTFGLCNEKYEWDLSWERFYQADTTRKRLFSFGFALSPWQTVPYKEYPSVGKFEGDRFDPRRWMPQTMTLPFLEMRDDDAFWAARRVAAFSDDMIRAAVHTGRVQRSRGRDVSGRCAHQAPQYHRARLPAGSESDRESTARRGRTAAVRQCRRRRGRGGSAQCLPRDLVAVRQRDRADAADRRHAESRRRRCRLRRGCRLARTAIIEVSLSADSSEHPVVETADSHALPPRRVGVEARGPRADAGQTAGRWRAAHPVGAWPIALSQSHVALESYVGRHAPAALVEQAIDSLRLRL